MYIYIYMCIHDPRPEQPEALTGKDGRRGSPDLASQSCHWAENGGGAARTRETSVNNGNTL